MSDYFISFPHHHGNRVAKQVWEEQTDARQGKAESMKQDKMNQDLWKRFEEDKKQVS
jgi:hypothetical protein